MGGPQSPQMTRAEEGGQTEHEKEADQDGEAQTETAYRKGEDVDDADEGFDEYAATESNAGTAGAAGPHEAAEHGQQVGVRRDDAGNERPKDGNDRNGQGAAADEAG